MTVSGMRAVGRPGRAGVRAGGACVRRDETKRHLSVGKHTPVLGIYLEERG